MTTPWKKVGWAVVTTLASGGALYAASALNTRWDFFESLKWRVPRMERTVDELRAAEKERGEAERERLLMDAVRHQEVMQMLKDIKERRR